MPAKSDIFAVCKELATRAGCKTVYRGFWLPAEMGLRPDQFPATGFWEDPEGIISGSEGHICKGVVNLDIWIYHGAMTDTGAPAIALDPDLLTPLDELHDKFLDYLSDSYPELHAQTISIFPEESNAWIPYWRYSDTPHAGATLRLHYDLNRAPAAH